jgi:restriction endonuclease S subunit
LVIGFTYLLLQHHQGNLKTLLKNIASIQTGVYVKTGTQGDIVYLQAKHFDENGNLQVNLHPDLESSNINLKHLLKHGDVLFAAKGSKNFAALYESKNPPAVASTSFFVIRVEDIYRSKVLPEFLVWLMNNPDMQRFLKGKAIGTSIVSISKAVLEAMEVFIPDIAIQQKILRIAELRSREKQLNQQLDELKEQRIQLKFNRILIQK